LNIPAEEQCLFFGKNELKDDSNTLVKESIKAGSTILLKVEWECTVCTFVNKAVLNRCEMCNTQSLEHQYTRQERRSSDTVSNPREPRQQNSGTDSASVSRNTNRRRRDAGIVDPTEVAAQLASALRVSIESDRQWNCSVCTFLNSPARTRCAMCNTNKPADLQQFIASAPVTERMESEDEEELPNNGDEYEAPTGGREDEENEEVEDDYMDTTRTSIASSSSTSTITPSCSAIATTATTSATPTSQPGLAEKKRKKEGCCACCGKREPDNEEAEEEDEGAEKRAKRGRGRMDVGFIQCGNCTSVLYCDRDCEIQHWSQHMKECNERRKAMRSDGAGMAEHLFLS